MGVFRSSRDVSGSASLSSRLLRIAVLTLAGLASAAPAKAVVYWTDDDPMQPRAIMEPEPQPQQQRRNKLRRTGAKLEKLAKDYGKPVGPLVIAISIERQSMRVFDSNGLFAQTAVSTGMRGHSTPMGVFSIIQKNKWHRSNIYSGAPMPYMQRITWSGIALHAGVLPGYPASHGCIRMPMAFATKIWGWTRMGARVIITPGEISPADISHPLLTAQKPTSEPVAAVAPATKPADFGLKQSSDTERTKTADASNAMTPMAKPSVLSDVADIRSNVAVPAVTKSDDNIRVTRRDVDEAVAKVLELPAPAAKPAQAAVEAPAKAQRSKLDPVTPSAPAISAQMTVDIAPLSISPTVKKDETRPAQVIKADTPTTVPDAAPKRSGQIAVLVSGKDGKMYVRQNFAPLFETPITIKPSDRPLGTHVFTARLDKDDAKTFHWSAVSLPTVSHRAADDDDNVTRRRKSTGAIEMKTRPLPDSAAEALDRLSIPADALGQISEALASGGSIIVSDQALSAGGETGQGTEFVVPLR